MTILLFFSWIWCIVTWFIWEIKSRFVLCKNVNLSVYCETRYGNLMLWGVPLTCLQSVVEELLWGVLAWFNRVLFFDDFKHGWRRLENFWESFLTWRACLKEICISKNSFSSLNWGPLFIETCKGSQVLFQCRII